MRPPPRRYNVVVAARDLTKLQYVASDCEEASGRQGSSLAGAQGRGDEGGLGLREG